LGTWPSEHVVAFFTLAKLGAVMVPLNVHLRRAGLEHLDALSRSTEDCWDLERSGYELRR